MNGHPTFFFTDPDPDPVGRNEDTDPTLNRNEEKYIYIIGKVGIKFDIMNHHFMLEFF